jgi:hypothetical protein
LISQLPISGIPIFSISQLPAIIAIANLWEVSATGQWQQILGCNQCPCQYVDFLTNLSNNDQVQAFLRDTKKTILYNFSLPWIVNF